MNNALESKKNDNKSSKMDLRLNLGFTFAILGLIAIGFFLQKNVNDIEMVSNQRAQARQIAYSTNLLRTLLVDAETGQRGFLLTGKQDYLAPYEFAIENIPNEYIGLQQALKPFPDQEENLTRAGRVIELKLHELASTIDAHESLGSKAALKIVLTDAGENYMNEIRVIVNEIEAHQHDVVIECNQRMLAIVAQSSFVIFSGSTLAILLVCIFLFLLQKNHKIRVSAEQNLRQSNANLQDQKATLSKVIDIQTKIATANLNSKTIMDLVVKHSRDLTGADAAIIEIVDGEDLVYHYVSGGAEPFLGMRIKIGNSFSGLCLKQNKSIICEDSETDSRVDINACRKVLLRSMVVVPLKHGPKLIGVLKNYSAKPNFFTEQNSSALQLITGILSSALGQANEFEQKNALVEALEKTKQELTISRDLAEAATKTKSRFLANMSHEFRTPLNGILGMTGLLLETPMNDEQKDFSSAIKSSGESLLRLVNDVLDFSKIEANKLDLENLNFDLESTLLDVQKSFTFVVRQKNLNLNIDIDKSVPTYVKGDPGRVRQILNNLIGNAIKFTPKGSIEVRVRGVQSNSKSVVLKFEIQDSGIGIEKSILDNLFQEFTQADISTTRRYGGSGLGLSICKRLVEQMNGQIGVTSEKDLGSTFWFTLHLDIGQESEREPEIESPKNAPSDRAWRILIAEDNQVNQVIALKMLEKLGFRADVVGNGKEAVETLQLHAYDLVLMDCHMPEMDGYEATAFIRTNKSILNNKIPIIAMTANAMKGDQERCLAAGMDDYISKPVAIKKLGEVLNKWINTIKAREQKAA